VQLALGMGGFSYARIVNNDQSCVPVLLTFLHKTGTITCAANIFSNLESFQCVYVVFSEGRVIYQDTITFVEVPTCCCVVFCTARSFKGVCVFQ